MDHERVRFRGESMSRNKQGYLMQMTRGQVDMLQHSISLPKLLALNIMPVEIAHTDDNHHVVYMSVMGEIVALILFDFDDTEGRIVWQKSSKGNAYRTGEYYSYVEERISRIAREAYANNRKLYAPRKPLEEFRAYGGRFNHVAQYEVTVCRGIVVVAVVQFSEDSLGGTIFWQRTPIDKNNKNTADRFAAREKEIVAVAQHYISEKKPWPFLAYRRTPYPHVPQLPKSLS